VLIVHEERENDKEVYELKAESKLAFYALLTILW